MVDKESMLVETVCERKSVIALETRADAVAKAMIRRASHPNLQQDEFRSVHSR